jgi:hypothetical protein
MAAVSRGEIPHGREERADAAEAVGDREQIRQVEAADHREVSARLHPG